MQSLRKIKQYISLLKHGGENSIPERKNILVEHEAFIIGKIKAYQDLLLLIKKKIEFYDEVLNDKNTESQKCMDYLMEWEIFFRSGIEFSPPCLSREIYCFILHIGISVSRKQRIKNIHSISDSIHNRLAAEMPPF